MAKGMPPLRDRLKLGYVLAGNPPRWHKPETAKGVVASVPRSTNLSHPQPSGGLPKVSLAGEVPMPVARIERGSGGDIRYGVTVPAMTPDTAVDEALRQFNRLKEYAESLKVAS